MGSDGMAVDQKSVPDIWLGLLIALRKEVSG